MIRLAVAGNPISSSLSPIIFNGIAHKYNIDSHYTRLTGKSITDINNLIDKLNITAINFTSPFKSEVYKATSNSDEYSSTHRASNLLITSNCNHLCCNTDDYAFKQILKSINLTLNCRILITGAGDTARLIKNILNNFGYFKITIAVRNVEKLRNTLQANYAKVIDINEIKSLDDFDLFINTIPKSDFDFSKVNQNSKLIIIDTIYRNPFLSGLEGKYISGYNWLIYQAIPTFKMIFGLDVSFDEILNTISDYKKKEKIVISGFMGSGKSSIAKALGELLNLKTIDTDREIERLTGKSIETIFSESGVDNFREIEYNVIKDIMKGDCKILSVGGGVLNNKDLSQFISQFSFNIYLHTPLDIIQDRLKSSDQSRPLLKIHDIEDLFNLRESTYFKYSDLIINNLNNIHYTVQLLANEINSYFQN